MSWLTTLLTAGADFLKSTPLAELSVWIAGTPFGVAINQNSWITPTVQSFHILGVAATFSAALMIVLRIFGVAGKEHTMAEIERRYTPWVWWGLVVLLVSGILVVIAEPARELLNLGFWTKMSLIVIVAAATRWFQLSVRNNIALWQPTSRGYGAIQAGAAVVTGVWCMIIILGRWIAYIGA
jgi:uncharacterized membrane protein